MRRDVPGDRRAEIFRAQFSKAYYNIGMIYDKMGKTKEASDSYKKSLKKCEEDPNKKLIQSATYKKAGTNYAVTLEKLGEREEAVKLLQELKVSFGNEVRVYNNLGIIQKRQGDVQLAIASYQSALQADPDSFFPNYNLAVLLAGESQFDKALKYFDKSLQISKE